LTASETEKTSALYETDKEAPSILVLKVQCSLDQANAARLIQDFGTLLKSARPKQLVVDLAGVDYIDDFGVTLLAGLKKKMTGLHGEMSLRDVSDPINQILAYHNFNTLWQDADRLSGRNESFFTGFGEATIKFAVETGYALSFLGDTCFSLLHILKHPSRLRGSDTLHNMQRVGVDALPIVGLISFLLGLIMAFMSSVQLEQFGANVYVASLVSLSMTRELGPIMTAIIVAGRSGSSFAAEIGTMKISEEIDALTTMGIDPHIFLVLPRMIATFLVVPLLTLFSDVFAILGGLLVGIGMLDLTVNGYISQTIHTLDLFDVFWGFFKGAIFALLISWTGCLRGFQVDGGAAGVGRATTSAVVTSIFLIILSDSLLVVILRYWEG
jgi:phospholipid/cholesterol/gamma-HCH transport system permease protein